MAMCWHCNQRSHAKIVEIPDRNITPGGVYYRVKTPLCQKCLSLKMWLDTIWSILEEEFVYGTDLSNRHKWRGLTILKRLMEETKFAFPPSIDGIRRQLGNYKTNDRNIAQVIVSVLIITALYLERVY